MTAYADVRSTVTQELQAALPNWSVWDHPRDSLDARTVAVAPRGARRRTATLWDVDLIAGVFVARLTVGESLDLLDATVPTIVAALADVGAAVEVSDPRPVRVGDVDYISLFVMITIESTI